MGRTLLSRKYTGPFIEWQGELVIHLTQVKTCGDKRLFTPWQFITETAMSRLTCQVLTVVG